MGKASFLPTDFGSVLLVRRSLGSISFLWPRHCRGCRGGQNLALDCRPCQWGNG